MDFDTEVSRLDLRYKAADEYFNDATANLTGKIPTLSTLLDASFSANKPNLIFDIKSTGIAEDVAYLLVEAVTKGWEQKQFWCMGPLHEELIAIKTQLPWMQIVPLIHKAGDVQEDTLDTILDRVTAMGAQAVLLIEETF